ncbi:MAG TPA: efflux RND transporter periplasmic adaptor subunit [Terriglobia bacterium]|nr:efflux RND transporter periplasmic adaptor subunit [Terriglobia bacterium]
MKTHQNTKLNGLHMKLHREEATAAVAAASGRRLLDIKDRRPEAAATTQNPQLSHSLWRLVKRFALMAIFCFPLIIVTGCNKSATTANAASPQASASSNGSAPQASYFRVPESQMGRLQIIKVEKSSIPHILRLPGSVAYNDFETTPVITQVGGRVMRVLVLPGQTVHPGQPMMEVTSPDYAQMRDNYIKARDAYNLAEKTYRRSQDLYTHHAISVSALEQAESAEVQANADMVAAWQTLRVLGLTSQSAVLQAATSPLIPVLAPIAGEVVERTVALGQVVQAGSTQCFTISNMSTVWVLASVYQSDLAYIRQGQSVTIETNAYPEVFRGRISYLAPAMDPNTRTLQVRIVTQNPGQRLKKDMYVTVQVDAGAIPNALSVPDSAVLRNSENQPFVYAVAGQGEFAQRLITIGQTQGGRTQVLGGLQAGDEVVADGSLFLQFANSLQH